jgi:hypothetical protein
MQRLHERPYRIATALALGVFLALGLVMLIDGGVTQAKQQANIIAFDVAEDGSRFVFDETPVHEDGFPAYGGEFVTQGYLYPAGTLTSVSGPGSGVNADGSPEFPDQVVGTWTCYGVHIGDGAHTVTGPWVITTQMYDFGNSPGDTSLVTNGFELADLNVPFQRAVTGGTGIGFERSEQTQTFLGFNESMGVSLQVSFQVKP